MDFSPATYTRLIESLQAAGYASQTIAGFFESPRYKTVLFRHDVDLLPKNALRMARLEHELGGVATYYFRAVPESWDEGIIREIAGMGHEVGYHYENLDFVNAGILGCNDAGIKKIIKRFTLFRKKPFAGAIEKKKLFEPAYEDFKRNLEKLRKLVRVKTICMHGSPLSRVSNLELWKRYDYKGLGMRYGLPFT